MKKYLRSSLLDRSLWRLESRNLMLDIFELIGLYIEYCASLENIEISVSQLEGTNKGFNDELMNQFYKFYIGKRATKRKYINNAEKYIRDILRTKNKSVSRQLLRKFYETKSKSFIKISVYAADIVELAFDYIYNKSILWQIFNKDILIKCNSFTNELKQIYPQDCLHNILRFQFSFIINYSGKFASTKKKEILKSIKKDLTDNIYINEIHKSCVKRGNSSVIYNII